MPRNNDLNDLLRDHIWQGHIRLVASVWERGIHEPWRPIEDQAWIDELDAMLAYGEIIQVPHSHEIKEA